jgi:YVTN family beta-propeller protein
VSFLLLAGIAACDGASIPANIAGDWTFALVTAAPCAVPEGIYDATDGDEAFTVTQNGTSVSASFTDSAGNLVTISATFTGGDVTGTITVQEPGGATSTCQGTAYASNTDSDDVSVIDLATRAETTTVTVGDDPRGLDVTPDGSLVFVPNRFSDDVTVIDTATNMVIATIPVSGTEPYNCEVTPDGSTVYVVNKSANGPSSVSVIDVATLTETAVVPLAGTGPEGLAISPNGAFAFVVNRNSGDVDVIDTATNTLAAMALTAPSSPRDAAFLPNGSKVYVVGEGGLAVLPGDPGSQGGVPILPAASGRDVVASPDGTRVYVARGPSNGELAVVDTSSDTVLSPIPLTTGGAYGIDICGDAEFAFVSNDSSDVAVVDLNAGSEVETISLSGSTAKQIKVRELPVSLGRLLVGSIVAVARNSGGMRKVDGYVEIVSDSDGLCVGQRINFWAMMPPLPPE